MDDAEAKTIFDAEMEAIHSEQFHAVATFARYMKGMWLTPEGGSCLLHAMNVLNTYSRLTRSIAANLNMPSNMRPEDVLRCTIDVLGPKKE